MVRYLCVYFRVRLTRLGMQCYEGLKAFRAPDDKSITIFRPSMNAERMQHSASFISIPEVPVDHFLNCCRLAVGLNADFVPPHHTGAAMYVRPLLFGSSAQLGLNPPEEYTFLVYVLPTGVYHGTKPVKALILEEFDRAAPEGTGSAKVGGNYAPVLKWSEKAYQSGYGITLHLDSKTRTEIEEFSTSGFIGVKKEGDNVTLVIPDSKRVIRSITSDSVQEIAKGLGWKVEVRPVCPSHLPEQIHLLTTAGALP
jgi:branched-chain amino acid aminotransferase